MKVWRLGLSICGALWLAGGFTPALADEAAIASTSVEQVAEIHRLFPQRWPIALRGWVDGGYTYNTASPTSRFNGPYNAIDRDIPQLNQLYLVAEKELRGTSGLELGGRVDAMYGYDYFLTQSNGLERNQSGSPKWNHEHHGIAIPQAYARQVTRRSLSKQGTFIRSSAMKGCRLLRTFFIRKPIRFNLPVHSPIGAVSPFGIRPHSGYCRAAS